MYSAEQQSEMLKPQSQTVLEAKILAAVAKPKFTVLGLEVWSRPHEFSLKHLASFNITEHNIN